MRITKQALILVSILFLAAVSALAADLSGKWKGTLKGGNGDIDTTMDWKVDGEKLTGTVTNMYGEEQITEGVVKGDDVSFVILAGGGQFKLIYKGKVEGDQVKFKVTIGDFGDGELVIKRA